MESANQRLPQIIGGELKCTKRLQIKILGSLLSGHVQAEDMEQEPAIDLLDPSQKQKVPKEATPML